MMTTAGIDPTVDDRDGTRLSVWIQDLNDVLDDEIRRSRQRDPYASLSPFEFLVDAIGHVRASFEQAMGLYAVRCNQVARVCALPAELLCRIFGFLGYADRIIASHVCQTWRTAALGMSLLWADVKSLNQKPTVLESRLARVPVGVPMQLAATIAPSRYKEILCALQWRMSDFRTLWLRTDSFKLDDDDIPAVGAALAQPAPLLSHLTLLLGRASAKCGWNSFPLLANDAPRLRSLKYWGTRSALGNWPLASQLHDVLFSEPSTTLASLQSVFSLFSRAEKLGIELESWELPASSAIPTITLSPDLKGLVVISNDNDLDLRDVLRCIPHGTVPVVCTCYRFPTSSTGAASLDLILDVSTALNRPIDILSLYSDGLLNGNHDLVDVWMETLHGTHRRIIMHSKFSLREAVTAYRSLTVLAISEVGVPEGSGEYELPYLKHLSVALLDSGTQTSRGHNSVFLLEPRTNPILLCPVLEIVEVVSYPRHPTIIAPDMISNFLRWHVKCSSLPVLRLNEVELVQNNVSEVAVLWTLISDIQKSSPTDTSTGRPAWSNHLPSINDLLSWETEMTRS